MHTEQLDVTDSNAAIIRDAIARAVSWLGVKRGVHAASEAIGLHPRLVRGMHYGEAFAATDDRRARALAFRRAIARDRAAKLRTELAELEGMVGDEMDISAGGRGTDMDRRVGVSERRLVRQASVQTPRHEAR